MLYEAMVEDTLRLTEADIAGLDVLDSRPDTDWA